MKWCLKYSDYQKTKKQKKVEVSDHIDEIVISLQEYNHLSLEEINNILNSIAEDNKRIIIDESQYLKNEISFFSAYNEKYPITIRTFTVPIAEDLELFRNISWFCCIPSTTKEHLNDILDETTASDIAIGDDLGFSMDEIRSCQKIIRVYPNIAQSSGLNNKLTDFFIRPEDIPAYEGYIDVCDFSLSKAGNVIADIYINQQKWIGDLSEIIEDLPQGLRGDAILPDFCYRRLNCEKRCQSIKGICNICNRYAHLSQKAKEVGIYFKA